MPTVHLSPIGNDSPYYANGVQLEGGLLYTYAANTTTPLATYTDEGALTANANPIVLSDEGYPSSAGARVQIWLLASNDYKFVLKNADGVTLWSMDDITGINDIALVSSEWISPTPNVAASAGSPVATTFTLEGDHRGDALANRWVKSTLPAGVFSYSIVTASGYSSPNTTVTVVNASGTQTGVTAIQWGLLRPDHPSVPMDADNLKATAIASATTTDIWSANGNYAHITGSVPITGFINSLMPPRAGARRRLVFDSGTNITHSSSFLICPGGASIAMGAGDVLDVMAESTTQVRVTPLGAGLPAGVIMDYGGATAPNGWLECDGSEVSQTTYAGLFAVIASSYGVGVAPLTFKLPDFRGRARLGRGTGTYVSRFTQADIDTATNIIAVPVNTSLITGTAVVFHAVTTAPTAAGFANDGTYYIIRASSTSVTLATTLAIAQAGVPGTELDFTNAGSGAMTMTVTLTARTTGQVGGEEAHALSSTEDYAHVHTTPAHYHGQQNGNFIGAGTYPIINATYNGNNIGPFAGAGLTTAVDGGGTSGSSGGNVAMNNMQPFGIAMTIIKT